MVRAHQNRLIMPTGSARVPRANVTNCAQIQWARGTLALPVAVTKNEPLPFGLREYSGREPRQFIALQGDTVRHGNETYEVNTGDYWVCSSDDGFRARGMSRKAGYHRPVEWNA